VAVTLEQITAWSLPTRPTKATDSRSRGFSGESVEVDAIPPDRLRGLADDCILQHLDAKAYERTLNVENEERESLAAIVAKLPEGQP
jgi:hypothetical protein